MAVRDASRNAPHDSAQFRAAPSGIASGVAAVTYWPESTPTIERDPAQA